ncbi:MAG: methyltransferase [Hyphomicrobium sp.]
MLVEVVATDDPVLVGYIEVLLRDQGIGVVVLDQNISRLHGAAGLQPQRMAVLDEDWAAARLMLIEAGLGAWISRREMAEMTQSGEPRADQAADLETTDDAFLGGQLHILQPKAGYRAGVDAVLLAAVVPCRGDHRLRVLDIGAGVGTVGLAVARRLPTAQVHLLERDARMAALARENAARNGLAARICVVEADVLTSAAALAGTGIATDSFDVVLANPPFHAEGRGTPATGSYKAAAHAMPEPALDHWVRAMARHAAPGGSAIIIHKADALGDILTAFDNRFGALRILPIHARARSPAIRIIVSGIKGSRAPLTMLPCFVLHDDGNGFTLAAQSVLRQGAGLELDATMW